jgi:Mg/Co/Ni transporter MgtE
MAPKERETGTDTGQTYGDKEANRHRLWPLVVPLTLLIVVTCGAISGCVLPLVFRRMGLDPALMGNPSSPPSATSSPSSST